MVARPRGPTCFELQLRGEVIWGMIELVRIG
jgi:hypothetical protein